MLSLEEGTLLVKLARKTIENYVRDGKVPPRPRVSEKLRKPRGVFVTLTRKGELRGCIGYPFPTKPLVDAVMDAAVSSAVRDPRFPPVRVRELSEIIVEVSVLTEPEVIQAKRPSEYPKHIEIGKHGLIVEWSGYGGLLLPQVPVEWRWDAEEFLSQTCVKAGLPPDCWLERDVTIKRFSAQIFKEKEPGGEVEEHPLG